jgi:hypothetical protein
MCAKAQAILTNAHCEILDSKSKSMELGWTENAHFLEHSVYSTNSGTKQKKSVNELTQSMAWFKVCVGEGQVRSLKL